MRDFTINVDNIAFYFQKIKSFLLDVLFPIHCLGCQAEGRWLCETCLKRIKLRDQQFCPHCEKIITPDGRSCFACKNKSPLAGLLVATSYQEPLASKAVHLFKYRFLETLAEPLSQLILKTLQSYELPLPDLIVPIPLHPRRLRWRGFNQSWLLAKNLAEKLLPGIDLVLADNLLVRKRYTLPQMSLKNHTQRHQNVHEAFTIIDPTKIKARRILLVDDITTTGSTIFECARILKEAGAKEIWAVVIAKRDYGKK
jgi:ComF family protein